jgi:hypothetical protein
MSRMYRACTAVLAALALSGAWTTTGAQTTCTTGGASGTTCFTTETVAMTVAKTTMLTVSGGTAFSLAPASGALTVADYDAGAYDVLSTITLTARANATWSATIGAATATFAAPCATKPAANLLWGRTAVTRATPLTVTPASAFASATNAATASLTQTLFFRVNVGWTTDNPGACSLGLAFAITAP